MRLYSFKYNNYYNRIVRRLSTIAEYKAADSNFKMIDKVSFNPADGVDTTQVVNFVPGDYVIITNNDNSIISRWFIIKAARTRTNQYILKLHRDLIVDNYNDIINAPCFIEKASYLQNGDPMIFNSENMGFNQIKKKEYQLQDETKSAWIVGYVPNNFGANDSGQYETKVVTTKVALEHWDIEVNNLSDWEYYQYIDNTNFLGASNDSHYGIAISVKVSNRGTKGVVCTFNEYGASDKLKANAENPYFSFSDNTGLNISSNSVTLFQSQYTTFVASIIDNAKNQYSTLNDLINSELGLNSNDDTDKFLALKGKIIKVGSEFFKIDILRNATSYSLAKKLDNTSSIYSILDANKPANAIIGSTVYSVNGTANNQTYIAYGQYRKYGIMLNPVYETIKCSIDTSKIYELDDSPYKMFCIPYSDELGLYKNGVLQCTSNKTIALALGSAIGESVGSANVYDVQLLPFCPVREYIKTNEISWDIDTDHISDIDNRDNDFAMIVKNTFTNFGYVTTETTNGFILNVYDKISGRLLNTYNGNTFSVNQIDFYFENAEEEELFSQDWQGYEDSGTIIELIVKQGVEATTDINVNIYDVLYQFNGQTITPVKIDYGNSLGVSDIKNEEDKVIGKIFWCRTSTMTFNITKFNDEFITDICKVTNPKIQNETELWRLVSPNYNGQFEFSVAKNNGVNFFNVDCNYKPFSPYIHINPDFGLLYGQDFNDARGLICGGDFSLPQVSSAWANFETSNKNYQNIFNREVQNMEVKNNISRIEERFNVASNAIGAGVGAGIASGNPLIGVGAGIASLGGGIADMYLNEELRNEALDYKHDMYGYQLGNIKAMPNSLTRTSAFTYNNKVFPILEYYNCTDEEVEALENKIKYNGMTVMRIGTISEFIMPPYQTRYIKGRLIRLDIHEDFHYISAIADEIYKGGFF